MFSFLRKLKPATFAVAIVAAVAVLLGGTVLTLTHHDHSAPVAHASATKPSPAPSAAPKPPTPVPVRTHYQWVTVKTGDTLSAIASTYRMKWQALYEAWPNRQTIGPDPNVITFGERLRVPLYPPRWTAMYRSRHTVPVTPIVSTPRPEPVSPVIPKQSPEPVQAQAPVHGAISSAGGAFLSGSVGSTTWGCIENAESSDNPHDPDGLYGILPSTWASLGYSGSPGASSVALQNQAALKLAAEDGSGPWDDPCTGT